MVTPSEQFDESLFLSTDIIVYRFIAVDRRRFIDDFIYTSAR
jgi:hypothetical protein